MSEKVSNYQNEQLKSSRDLKEVLPSSYSINQEYFNGRLIRIKEKIDGMIKENMNSSLSSTKSKDKNSNIREDQYGSSMSTRTITDSFGRSRQRLSAQKITEQTKINIQKIYNEIHLIEVTVTKDENMIETNTFELKSFLKDLRNQEKRLTKLLPDGILFELEKQKKKTFKKSDIPKEVIEAIVQGFQTTASVQKQEDEQQKIKKANELIQNQQKKRRIYGENKMYYQDSKDQKCDLFHCQLI